MLLFPLAAAVVLWTVGLLYSRWLSRQVGEDSARTTPAVARNDGRD